MATGPLTATRYATEFRAEISKVGRRIVGACPSVTNRHATNPDGTTDGKTRAEPEEGSRVSCQDNNSADRRQQTP